MNRALPTKTTALTPIQAATPLDARTAAAKTLARVLAHNESLASLLPAHIDRVTENERSFYQQLCYGTLRWFYQLSPLLNQLLQKPLKNKDSDLQAALLIGLYQLIHTRVPDHAAIAATVNISKKLKKHWGSKLINGVLRNFQRQREALFIQLQGNPSFKSAHPNWLVKGLGQAWAENAQCIFDANNQQPPFTLRINPAEYSRNHYLEKLQAQGIEARPTPYSPFGITLTQACDVFALPDFSEGLVSVQDEAAQLAASLLDLKPGLRVLDACCAPGGKTGHLLETEPELAAVVALDLEQKRLVRVHENLSRLGQDQRVEVICGDAAEPQQWWDGQLFDRILLDAPCSATGVIRRHPDIKLLRKPDDIKNLARLQKRILHALWPLLKTGGTLVYATCSLMPTENSLVIETFLNEQKDCQERKLKVEWGIEQPCGRQLLPQKTGHDGFYYAALEKYES